MGNWDTGLFDCFSDIKVCLVTYYCFPCQVAYQKAAVEEHQCGLGDLLLTCCCPFCCTVSVRGKIREKYGFEGSVFGDCLTVLYCGVCAASQHTRQLDMKGAKPAGLFMEK